MVASLFSKCFDHLIQYNDSRNNWLAWEVPFKRRMAEVNLSRIFQCLVGQYGFVTRWLSSHIITKNIAKKSQEGFRASISQMNFLANDRQSILGAVKILDPNTASMLVGYPPPATHLPRQRRSAVYDRDHFEAGQNRLHLQPALFG